LEALFILLVLTIPVMGLVGCILGIVALSKISGLRRQVLDLRLDVESLDDRLRRSAPEAPDAPAPEPEPVVAPEIVGPPDQDRGPLSEPIPTESPAPVIMPDPEIPSQPPEPDPVVMPPPSPVDSSPPGVPPTPRSQPFEWERWLGVRGAAVAGGVVLALASVLFFKYSIEHGLIPPAVRVMLGLVAGAAGIVGSEFLRARRQPAAADAVAGAGIVALYASLWAALHLYQLIGFGTAFVAMAVVTATCGVLAHRRSSLVIALLGLVGGFAAPLLTAGDRDQPVALFTYVMVLDLGLLWLARRRGWGVLVLLCVAGTTLYQALWIPVQSAPDRVPLALAVLAAFALVFALVFARRGSDEAPADGTLWRLARAGGVSLPFFFAMYMAGSADLGEHLWPLAALVVLLIGAATYLSTRPGQGMLAPLAAALSLGVLGAWFGTHAMPAGVDWSSVAAALAVPAVFLVAAEIAARRRPTPELDVADHLASVGLLGILTLAAWNPEVTSLWPWLVGWLVIAGLVIRQAQRANRGWLQLLALPGTVLAVAAFVLRHGHDRAALHEPDLMLAVAIALAVVAQILSAVIGAASLRGWAEHASAVAAVAALGVAFLLVIDDFSAPMAAAGGVALCGVLVILAATRLGSGSWLLLGLLGTAFVHLVWVSLEANLFAEDSQRVAIIALGIVGATAALFAHWPGLVPSRFADRPLAWTTAALSGVVFFPSLGIAWDERFGSDAIAVVPVALAAVTLAAALRAGRVPVLTEATRRSAQVWLLGVTLSLVSIAIPLQLEKQWITIGWALNGLALIALWHRLDHVGLKHFALLLLGAATVRLVMNPEVLTYLPRGATPILNWVLYTYLVPAAALLASGHLLRGVEAERVRSWEPTVGGQPLGAPLCVSGGILVLFVWVNLAIADVFGTGSSLTITFERLPARDLTTSIAWALFALALLIAGVRTGSRGLRWTSLGLMIVTIAKVFLHDLGELEDLYRVASLLGLAVSLILVSLVYQRFVLGGEPGKDE
jgi:uncharacterized membrane protein